MSSTNSSTDYRPEFLSHMKERGKLRNWVMLGSAQDMHDKWDLHRKNEEARARWVRQNAFGESGDTEGDEQNGAPEDDDMRNTILGDVTHPTPVVYPPQQSSVAPALLGAAIGLGALGIPTAGILGYLAATRSAPEKPAAAEYDDTAAQLKLGRIEDYIRD